MGKKNKPFDEILAGLARGEFEFDPRNYLDDLLTEFMKETPHCCTWCLLDCIYSVDSATLMQFFAYLVTNYRDYYELETAIDWLLRQNTEVARQVIWDKLPAYLGNHDVDIRAAAIRGLRNLDTREIRAFLWNARSQYAFASEQETTEFRETIEACLAASPEGRNFHIIP